MKLDVVSDVFDPVAKHIESRLEHLHNFLQERHGRKVPRNAGLERDWFNDEVREALIDLDPTIQRIGPDLVLHRGDSTIMVDLQAATDLNITDTNTSPREGVKRHGDVEGYAGCIFLGDGSDESRIRQLSGDGVQLRESRISYHRDRTWILGLLVSGKAGVKLT